MSRQARLLAFLLMHGLMAGQQKYPEMRRLQQKRITDTLGLPCTDMGGPIVLGEMVLTRL